MALLLRPRPAGFWSPNQVPMGPVEIDESHPLAAGLVLAYLPGVTGTRDVCGVGPTLTLDSAAVFGPTAFGPGLQSNAAGNSGMASAIGTGLCPSSAGTLFWAGQSIVSYGGSSVNLFGFGTASSSTAPFHYFSLILQSSALNLAIENAGGTSIDTATITSTLGTKVPMSASASFATNVGVNTAITGYLNGAQTVNTTKTRTSALSYGSPIVSFQNIPASSRNPQVYGAVGLYWNRVLSVDEHAMVARAPFSVFLPKRRSTRLYYLPPSLSGPPPTSRRPLIFFIS